jgi:hypothetical protein
MNILPSVKSLVSPENFMCIEASSLPGKDLSRVIRVIDNVTDCELLGKSHNELSKLLEKYYELDKKCHELDKKCHEPEKCHEEFRKCHKEIHIKIIEKASCLLHMLNTQNGDLALCVIPLLSICKLGLNNSFLQLNSLYLQSLRKVREKGKGKPAQKEEEEEEKKKKKKKKKKTNNFRRPTLVVLWFSYLLIRKQILKFRTAL